VTIALYKYTFTMTITNITHCSPLLPQKYNHVNVKFLSRQLENENVYPNYKLSFTNH